MIKKIRINKRLGKYNIGDKLRIEFKNNIPVDSFWRRRFEDSKIDNCVTIVEPSKIKRAK